MLGASAGQAVVRLRYANFIGALGGPADRTIDLTVNGSDEQDVAAGDHADRLVDGHATVN